MLFSKPACDWLIVGLGNPGAQYEKTRHNMGFRALDLLAKELGCKVDRAKFRGLTGQAVYGGQKLLLLKPQTFMNLSGLAVKELMDYYKISPENVLVIYDDIDIPQGTVRIRPNGSAGTHNGMRSIVAETGTEDFPRIRVGVGQRGLGWNRADWVLSRYQTPEEQEIADKAYEQAADAVLEYLKNGISSAMNRYNTKKPKKEKPPKENPPAGEEQSADQRAEEGKA